MVVVARPIPTWRLTRSLAIWVWLMKSRGLAHLFLVREGSLRPGDSQTTTPVIIASVWSSRLLLRPLHVGRGPEDGRAARGVECGTLGRDRGLD